MINSSASHFSIIEKNLQSYEIYEKLNFVDNLFFSSVSQTSAISIHLFSPELVRLTFCTFLLLGFAPTRLAGPAVWRPVARGSSIAAGVRVLHVAPGDWVGEGETLFGVEFNSRQE